MPILDKALSVIQAIMLGSIPMMAITPRAGVNDCSERRASHQISGGNLRDLDRCGYPFYIRLNGLTSQLISFHGNYCKDIWITYPLIEIQIIKNWLPVAKPEGPIALFKKRQMIINTARNRLMKANGNFDDWDEIPF